MAQMRDDDAPANHQGHVESFVEFLILPAGLYALQDVVVNAIVARKIFEILLPMGMLFSIDSHPPFLYNTFVDKISLQYSLLLTLEQK